MNDCNNNNIEKKLVYFLHHASVIAQIIERRIDNRTLLSMVIATSYNYMLLHVIKYTDSDI